MKKQNATTIKRWTNTFNPYFRIRDYATSELGLKGCPFRVYLTLANYGLYNYKHHFCACCSYAYLSVRLNYSISAIKRSINFLINNNIISVVGKGLNGRKVYHIDNCYNFDNDFLSAVSDISALSVPNDHSIRKLNVNLNKELTLKEQKTTKEYRDNLFVYRSLLAPKSALKSCLELFSDSDLQETIRIAKVKWIKTFD